MRDQAAAVLHGNDAGTWTKASPHLYPHQWSWDSAFIAIGWAHLDAGRAMTELEQLFAAQWATGMVPHIVFRVAEAGVFAEYFDPFTGKPLGSPQQSWTAAVVLDWLSVSG